MTKLLYAASAAAILTVAGHLPATAQSSTNSMTTPMITCRDLSSMDRDMARSVVFYVSGFHTASQQAQASGTGVSGSSGSTGTSGSDVTGSTSTAGGTTDAGGAASGGSSGASGTVVAQLPGFGNVDADRIMSECAASPDRQISEMIGQAGSGSGATTTP